MRISSNPTVQFGMMKRPTRPILAAAGLAAVFTIGSSPSRAQEVAKSQPVITKHSRDPLVMQSPWRPTDDQLAFFATKCKESQGTVKPPELAKDGKTMFQKCEPSIRGGKLVVQELHNVAVHYPQITYKFPGPPPIVSSDESMELFSSAPEFQFTYSTPQTDEETVPLTDYRYNEIKTGCKEGHGVLSVATGINEGKSETSLTCTPAPGKKDVVFPEMRTIKVIYPFVEGQWPADVSEMK
jgi:hypothetical protein